MRRLTVAALLLLALLSEQGSAEVVKGDAALLQTLRKAQNMLRQLSQDKAELEAANAALTEQVKTFQARLAQAESRETERRRLEAALAMQHQQNDTLRQRIASDAEHLREMIGVRTALTGELARWRRDNALLVKAVEERSRWEVECAAKNRELVQLNHEMLERFADRGFWEKLKSAEPLTGLGNVAEENARDEFAYRLEDLEVTPHGERDPAPAKPANSATDDEGETEE